MLSCIIILFSFKFLVRVELNAHVRNCYIQAVGNQCNRMKYRRPHVCSYMRTSRCPLIHPSFFLSTYSSPPTLMVEGCLKRDWLLGMITVTYSVTPYPSMLAQKFYHGRMALVRNGLYLQIKGERGPNLLSQIFKIRIHICMSLFCTSILHSLYSQDRLFVTHVELYVTVYCVVVHTY